MENVEEVYFESAEEKFKNAKKLVNNASSIASISMDFSVSALKQLSCKENAEEIAAVTRIIQEKSLEIMHAFNCIKEVLKSIEE